jgi:hypothetical protein
MLRKIENLIPAALDAVDSVLKTAYPGGIPKGYQGAVSGLGTTLNQMGLLPTLAVYADQDSGAEISRQLLIQTLVTVIKNSAPKDADKQNLPIGGIGLLLHMKDKPKVQQSDFKADLIQAAIAFKLAIRTHPLI